MAALADTRGTEQEILGAILLRGERYTDAARTLTGAQFTDPTHKLIWRVMGQMATDGEPIDAISVSQALIEQGKGALVDSGAYVTQLAGECVGTDPKHHVERLQRLYLQREARRIGAQLAESDGSFEAVDAALRDLMGLQQGTVSYEHHIKDALRDAVDQLHEAQARKGELTGIPTGLAKLDEHLGGLQKSDLIIVGARPAMGKTSLVLNMAHSALKGYQHAGGIITAEQPAVQIAQRHQSSASRVALHAMRQGRITGDESRRIIEATKHLANMRYWLFDRSKPSIDEVVRVARGWHHQHHIEILYLDYIQRIRGHGDGPVEQIGSVVSGLKTLARDLNIPVVALAQINRKVEERPDKRPKIADLKGSGEIEQEADQILLVYRDEVYDEDSMAKGIAEINIAKNRHGYTGTTRVSWAGEFLTFGDLDAEYQYGGHH